MFEERTGIPVSNIVILMSCDDGNTVAFEEKPKKYIKKLMNVIETYYKQQ
jgi:hypothetical protein